MKAFPVVGSKSFKKTWELLNTFLLGFIQLKQKNYIFLQ